MAVSFDLPVDIERNLREALGDLDQAAKEAALVELYRQETISQHELSLALSVTRLETEAILKKHHVTEDLSTAEEYEASLASIRAMTKE